MVTSRSFSVLVKTAAMLPDFLRYLRDNHYRVVHVVPTGPAVDFDGVP